MHIQPSLYQCVFRSSLFVFSTYFLPLLLAAESPFQAALSEGAPFSPTIKVHPEAVFVFSKSYTGKGRDLNSQAVDALGSLRSDVENAGLSLDAVVNVRGYLKSVKGESMAGAFQEWNQAFTQNFSEHQPTRTTIGVSDLPSSEERIALDAILAVNAADIHNFNTLSNSRLLAHSGSTSSLRAVKANSALLITAGILGDPSKKENVDGGEMRFQAASAFQKLSDELAKWGLTIEDLAFVRALLSPDRREGSEAPVDFEGFNAAWAELWDGVSKTPSPPLSVSAAPGYGGGGRLIEVEFYAAFPKPKNPFANGASETLAIRKGAERSLLSSSVAIHEDAYLTWFSGALDVSRRDMYTQSVETLLNLEERATDAGVGFRDVVQLRAYLNLEPESRGEIGGWNRAYRRFFDHPKLNPEKPVRTAFPVEMLAGGARVEVEILTASEE